MALAQAQPSASLSVSLRGNLLLSILCSVSIVALNLTKLTVLQMHVFSQQETTLQPLLNFLNHVWFLQEHPLSLVPH